MRKKLVRNYLFYQHYPYKPLSADLTTVSHLYSQVCLSSVSSLSLRPAANIVCLVIPLSRVAVEVAADNNDSLCC